MKKLVFIFCVFCFIGLFSGCFQNKNEDFDYEEKNKTIFKNLINDLKMIEKKSNPLNVLEGIYIITDTEKNYYSMDYLMSTDSKKINAMLTDIDTNAQNTYVSMYDKVIKFINYTNLEEFMTKSVNANDIILPNIVVMNKQTGLLQYPNGNAIENNNLGDIKIIASRISGVAPLMVHFEADSTNEEFHNRDYAWDFGDINSGNWGTNNKSKNTAKGAVTAHLFENYGEYTVKVIVKNKNGDMGTKTVTITVENPDTIYAGDLTTCVNQSGDSDFSEAPIGARRISTDDLSTITQYASQGRRILFKRGSSWTINNLQWPENEGPVTIGAYGTGVNPDKFGIFENAPNITVSSGNFFDTSNKMDWRIMDLNFVDMTKTNSVIGGVFITQRNLIFRLRTVGFGTAIGWSHWVDPNGIQMDEMAIVSCDVLKSGAHAAYIGSERLILLGNNFEDADDSHVVRVWQAYKSIISNNMFSGSSLKTSSGRHALKMHGPSEEQVNSIEWDCLRKRTEYVVVSDNIFGSSGPWPVSIGPQDDWKDERLSNIIFERNRYCADFGNRSTNSLQLDTAFLFLGRQFTIRNNIVDGSNFGSYFTGITVRAGVVAPNPLDIRIYNNTIYKSGNLNGQDWIGITITEGTQSAEIRNNLLVIPEYNTGSQRLIADGGTDTIQSNNILNGNIVFEDADNSLYPLQRSFKITENSTDAIDTGYEVNNFDDFYGNNRFIGNGYDIGACEYNK